MSWAVLVIYSLVLILGAAVGSFLNVVVYRLPAGLSLFTPPSRCPQCHTFLKPYDNIPVLGWLWLKGRCRYCHTPIAKRYPIVEFITAVLFLITFAIFGVSLQTLGYWFFISWLLGLALIDLDTMLLPNLLTQSGVIAGLIFHGSIGFFHGQLPGLGAGLLEGFLGAVIGLWLFDLIRIGGTLALGQEAMGGGDAKLAAMIGAWLGWPLMLVSSLLACLVGSIIGGGGMVVGLIGRRQPIPFGPFLALGAGLAIFVGEPLLSTYRHWMGL